MDRASRAPGQHGSNHDRPGYERENGLIDTERPIDDMKKVGERVECREGCSENQEHDRRADDKASLGFDPVGSILIKTRR